MGGAVEGVGLPAPPIQLTLPSCEALFSVNQSCPPGPPATPDGPLELVGGAYSVKTPSVAMRPIWLALFCVRPANRVLDGRGVMPPKGGHHHGPWQTARSAERTAVATLDRPVAGQRPERAGLLCPPRTSPQPSFYAWRRDCSSGDAAASPPSCRCRSWPTQRRPRPRPGGRPGRRPLLCASPPGFDRGHLAATAGRAGGGAPC